jgi:cell division protein FtsQ
VTDDTPVGPPVAASDKIPLGGSDADRTLTDIERFEERRREVRAAARTRRRRIVVAVLIVAGIVGVAALVMRSPLLDVDEIEWIGAGDLDTDALAASGGLSKGDPMIFLDPERIADRLEKLPVITRAAVRRRWPDAVEVRVSRRSPVAVITGAVESMAVASDGISMGPPAEESSLRQISDPSVSVVPAGRRVDPSLVDIIRFVTAIPESVAVKVTSIEVSETDEVTLHLGESVVVLVGEVGSGEKKLRSMTAMLSGAVDLEGMCQLDVRTPDDPKLRRSPHCS